MTEATTAQFRNEGDPAFETDSENETPPSSPDETNEHDGDPADEGDDNASPKVKKPHGFADDPAWQRREQEWNDRYAAQEAKHDAAIEALRQEFGDAKKSNAEQSQKPKWFGGTDEQWELYQADRKAELKAAEEHALQNVQAAEEAKAKATADATIYMQSEISAIEGDKALNPNGLKIDVNRLLAIVMDKEGGEKYPLIDGSGRWNYRQGWRILRPALEAESKGNRGDRKNLAAATTAESRAEMKPAPYKTSAVFKKNRPW